MRLRLIAFARVHHCAATGTCAEPTSMAEANLRGQPEMRVVLDARAPVGVNAEPAK
jgi:hypothetical protein